MQLALSLAFVSGEISASNMSAATPAGSNTTCDTIDLNGTAVGFSHGDDTFGWRFYPRFQTPDVESNATVFFRDLLIGGPNRDEALCRTPAGARHARVRGRRHHAVVRAVRHLDVSSNWFDSPIPSQGARRD